MIFVCRGLLHATLRDITYIPSSLRGLSHASRWVPPLQAALKLSEEQVQQCRELRAHLRRRFATVQMAKQCSQDLLDDMVGGMTATSLPLSTESAMQLLDIGDIKP